MPLPDEHPTAVHHSGPSPTLVAGLRALEEHAGETLGQYRLLELIGEGGFGMVWLAERREPFVQRVAIKIIKPGMDSREIIARFEQERQALAVMDHPNVARVHDAGTTPLGRPYFVMEHVAGIPVTEYCDQNRLTVRQRLELFIPICEAVQHAHQKGIIHRDLKPANILITVRDGQPIPKVIDFGVAKAISHALTDKTIFTETGQMIGTPEYMSPEQADMRSGDIDTRSDVFSLGAVLYELLTGGTPFESRSLREMGYDGLVRTIREVEPVKPSTRYTMLEKEKSGIIAGHRRMNRGELASELRRELDWIPLKALRKDRTERYASPSDLARDIRNYVDGRPLEAGPESTMYRLRKMARRNKGLFAAGAAVAAALVVGVIGFAWQAHRAGAERDLAIAAEKQAREARIAAESERNKSQAINEFIQSALKASDPNEGGRQDVSISDAMQIAIKRLDDGAFRTQPEVEAGLGLTIAEVLNGNARSEQALALAQRGLDLAQKAHPGDHPDVARALTVVGTCLHTLRRDTDSLAKFEDSLAMSRRLAAKGSAADADSFEIAQGLGNVAEALGSLNRPKEALPNYQKSLDMLQRLAPGDDARVATAMNNLAFCLQSLGKADEALPMYERALQMHQRLYPSGHPDVARGLNNVGYCLQAMGRAKDALPYFEQALEMRQRLFKGDHPMIARAMTNVATCLVALKRTDEALKVSEDSLAMLRRVYPTGHPDVASALSTVATTLHTLGRPQDALPYYEEALAMQRRLHPTDHVDLANALNNVGRTRFLLKQPKDALEPLTSALAMYQTVAPGDQANTANAMANLAACQNALGKRDEALDTATKGSEMAARILPETSPIRKKCDTVLAEVRKVAEADNVPGKP
jgi:serine/threonine protein kinase/Tfp pilus assembly protein PilF